VRFTVDPELELFAESVRAALQEWEAPLEPVFGEWQDDRDDALAARLAAAGWDDLGAAPELLGAVVAGGIELGRAVAPLSLLDDATLGGPLRAGGRARHGESTVEGVREPTLDGAGTLRDVLPGPPPDPARLRAWGVATLAYLAGLAAEAVDEAVAHATSREQFGAPLSALPAVQARLADAALVRDGILLCAWAAAAPEAGFPADELAMAGCACCAVTAHVHQVHGALGFALEGGVHRFHRRAKTVQAWADAVVRELPGEAS
jgi:Acyl-CoA dehydrogenase, C-terminal domain